MLDDKVIALYERLSNEDEDVKRNDAKSESNSIGNQRKLLYTYIRQKPELAGMRVVEFKDDGYSGTNFERPKFLELMEEVRRGNIDIIIVKDFSRLGRDYLDAGNYLDKIFPAYGIRFIAINDGYDSNSHIGQTTGLDVGLKNIVNDMYSKDISLKRISTNMIRYKKGEYIGPHGFYGYKHDKKIRKLIIDQEAAKVIKRIFQCSIDGYSTNEIAALLNNEGILSPHEYKKRNGMGINSNLVDSKAVWTKSMVKRIICDERYVGKMISHKSRVERVGSNKTIPVPKEEWIIVKGTHEAIISQELFDGANEALTQRAKKKIGRKGKLNRHNLFRCAHCKHKLQFTGSSDKRKHMSCGFGVGSNDEICKSLRVSRKDLEEKVIYTLNTMGSVYLDAIKRKKEKEATMQIDYKKMINANKSKIRALQVERRNHYLKYTNGEVTREAYVELAASYSKRITELETKINELETELEAKNSQDIEIDDTSKEIETYFCLSEYDEEQLNQVIDAIYVSEDGSMEISFKRRDILNEVMMLG